MNSKLKKRKSDELFTRSDLEKKDLVIFIKPKLVYEYIGKNKCKNISNNHIKKLDIELNDVLAVIRDEDKIAEREYLRGSKDEEQN